MSRDKIIFMFGLIRNLIRIVGYDILYLIYFYESYKIFFFPKYAFDS